MTKAAILLLFALGCASCASTSRGRRGDLEVLTIVHDSTKAYLLVSRGGDLMMVDSGYEENAERLEQDIRDAGFDPGRIRAIVLTHAHGDHAGGARHFQKKFGTRVIAGAGDREMLAAGRNGQQPVCATGWIGRLRHSKDEAATYNPYQADVWVEAGSSLALAPLTGIDAVAVSLPGHTRGSLVVSAGDSVFVGDLFRGSLIGHGAATHLYMCDLDANRRDVTRLLREISPQARMFYPGHFGPVERDAVAEEFGLR